MIYRVLSGVGGNHQSLVTRKADYYNLIKKPIGTGK